MPEMRIESDPKTVAQFLKTLSQQFPPYRLVRIWGKFLDNVEQSTLSTLSPLLEAEMKNCYIYESYVYWTVHHLDS